MAEVGPASPAAPARTASLGDLAMAAGDLLLRLEGEPATAVRGLSCALDRVSEGDLYFCVEPIVDGQKVARGAVAGGALALCVERPTAAGVPELVVSDSRRAMARIAAAFYGHPAQGMLLLGVTGTLGKTTTAWLLESILVASGRTAGLIGSITARIAGEPRWIGGTTPEPPDLHRVLAGMRSAGVGAVAMEVSSHALAWHRVEGLRFAAVGFTNLSPDHLDFHGTMERYFASKRALFDPSLAERGAVNADDEHGRALLQSARIACTSFGRGPEAEVRATEVSVGRDGSTFRLIAPEGTTRVTTPLVGAINVANCLAAAAVALQAGIDLEAVAAGIARLESVPGRFDRLDLGQPFAVVIDFARTPRALEEALGAARLLATGKRARVTCVFGCPGDGDHARRRLMGEAAARTADALVLTLDSPGEEDPLAIIADITAGSRATGRRRGLTVITDRREAIAHAIGGARPGDVVVIAGRGLERRHTVLGRTFTLDDREVAREALEARGWELAR